MRRRDADAHRIEVLQQRLFDAELRILSLECELEARLAWSTTAEKHLAASLRGFIRAVDTQPRAITETPVGPIQGRLKV